MEVAGTGMAQLLVPGMSEPDWDTVFAAGAGTDLVVEESDCTELAAQ